MIVDKRMTTFINSMDRPMKPFLEELYKDAVLKDVPVIRKEMQSFLRTLLLLIKPKKILEVGTAVGFSAMLMADTLGPDVLITTIENYDVRIPIARENFKKNGFEDQITLLEGDAAKVLDTLDEKYDFIFMDAAKGQYIYYLPKLKRLMREGSVLVTDNVLQEGEIIESHYIVERRDRTIHKRMREYLYALKHDDELETSIIPLGDGITLSVKKEIR